MLPVAIVLDLPDGPVRRAQRRRGRTATSARTCSAASTASCAASLRGPAARGVPHRARAAHRRRRSTRRAITRTRLYTDLRHETGPFDVDRRRARLPGRAGATADHARLRAGRATPTGRAVGARAPRRPARGLRRRPGRPRPGHARRAAAGDGHGRRPGTALCVPGQPRGQAAARALRGRNVDGLATGWRSRWSSWPREPERSAPRWRGSSTAWSATTCWTAGGSWSRTPGWPSGCTAAPRAGSASSACTAQTTGETDEYGLPVRYPWAEEYRGRADGAVRPHPGAGRRVGEQHDVPGHRLRLRRLADRAAVSRTDRGVSVPAAARLLRAAARAGSPVAPTRARILAHAGRRGAGRARHRAT